MRPVLRRAAAQAFRRTYATDAPRPPRVHKPKVVKPEVIRTPTAALAAEAASYPSAPRLGRRMGKRGNPTKNAPALSPELVNDAAAARWAAHMRASPLRHQRVRGIEGEGMDVRAVGQKVYLPNIIFRLVRNATPVGQAYNPYEATFRVPLSITKTDVRAYLSALYGVQTTYIRTDVYRSPLLRNRSSGAWNRTLSHRTYKRAVVGLVEPFYYPQAMEDMGTADREARKKSLEENFAIEAHKDAQKLELLRMTKKNSTDWHWRGGMSLQRGKIIKKIMDRRLAREEKVGLVAEELDARRQAGSIDIPA